MSEPSSTPVSKHPLHTPSMAEVVSGMPQNVRQLYADYMLALDDAGTPGYDKRLAELRHAVANAINAELLKEEEARLDAR